MGDGDSFEESGTRVLAKYALRLEVADIFTQKGRRLVLEHLPALPEETRQVVRQHLELLESTERQKKVTEQRLQNIVQQRARSNC